MGLYYFLNDNSEEHCKKHNKSLCLVINADTMKAEDFRVCLDCFNTQTREVIVEKYPRKFGIHYRNKLLGA